MPNPNPGGGNPGGGNPGGGNPGGGNPGGGNSNLITINGSNNVDDVLTGTVEDELLRGFSGNDQLFGEGGDDVLEGGSGDDILSGGPGEDVLDGGADFDQALYEDSVLGYDIVIGDGTSTITDADPSDGDTGPDTLIDIEEAVFSDVTVFLDGRNNDPFTVPDTFATTGGTLATTEDESLTFAGGILLANDREFDGDVMTITSLDISGTTGIAVLNPDGTITYDSNGKFEYLAAGESAEDSFLYIVEDGNGGQKAAAAKPAKAN